VSSPSFDVSSYNEPMLSYETFIWSVEFAGQTPATGSGSITVTLDNGFETKELEELIYEDLSTAPEWTYSDINILDFFGPNPDSLSNLVINFRAFSPTFDQLAEMGLDDFVVWDANPTSAEELLVTRQFEANPNPSKTNFNIQYELESFDSNTRLLVYNALGQLVQTIELNDQLGTISFGEDLETGVYFANIIQGDTPSRTIRLVKI